MKKYDLSKIMSAAWRFFRKGVQSFAVALRMAWANAKTQNTAKAEAGIIEETHTWAGWKALGFEVIHESKALCEVSEQLGQLHDLLQIFNEMQDENAEGLRCTGARAGAIQYYLARSEMTDSLM